MTWDTWGYVLFHSIEFMWFALAALTVVIGLTVRRYEQKIREEKAATFVGLIGTIVDVVAATNSKDVAWQAALGISCVRGGIEAAIVNRLVLCAAMARQRREEAAAFDVMGEHARALVMGIVRQPDFISDISDAIWDEEMDDAAVAVALDAVSQQELGATQLVFERMLLGVYAKTLIPQGGDDHPGWSAIWDRLKWAASWIWRHWGRIFCFTTGALFVLTGAQDGYATNNNAVLGGGVLLLTGLALHFIARNKTT